MAANTDAGALLLVKKLGALTLIFFGILSIALGLEYRTTGLSIGLIAAGIAALLGGMGLLVLKIIRRNSG